MTCQGQDKNFCERAVCECAQIIQTITLNQEDIKTDKTPIFIDGDFNDHYMVGKSGPSAKRKGGMRFPILPEPCPQHKMKNQVMGYNEHHDWMKEQVRKGLKQKQCDVCGYYLFQEEI